MHGNVLIWINWFSAASTKYVVCIYQLCKLLCCSQEAADGAEVLDNESDYVRTMSREAGQPSALLRYSYSLTAQLKYY